MVKEGSLRSKNLYKVFLVALKILPMLISLCYLLNTITAYLGYNIEIFSFIGGVSLLPWIFLYVSAVVFRFCMYHKMFLFYILSDDIINYLDYFFDFTTAYEFFIIHMSIAGVFLFIILYLYKKRI